MSETPDGPYEAEVDLLDDAEDPDVPELNTDSDNEPDDSTTYPEVEVQDAEATERPAQNKHEE